jgi:hypothetical protein
MPPELKKRILEMRETLGYTEAKKRFRAQALSESLSQKLLAGKYPFKPRPSIMRLIEMALKECP